MSSIEEKPAEAPTKTRVQDLRNAELVSRFLAATPPYLYSALPLQPHAFFFSEMLRSFSNARQGCRPPHYHRRFKRRSHKYFAENEDPGWRRPEWPKQDEEKKAPEIIRPEVPLELTVDKQPKVRAESPRMSPKNEPRLSSSPGPPDQASSFVDVGTEEPAKPAPCLGRTPEAVPPNLILPPPPPMWYPPLYNPQFGVDPLNFFIDLRVSGHIYDRKRMMPESVEPNLNQEDGGCPEKRLARDLGQRRLSAFSVPVRSSNVTVDAPAKYFDHTLPEKQNPGKSNGTSYIMKNLKTVYDHLKTTDDQKEDSKIEKDDDSDINDEDIVD